MASAETEFNVVQFEKKLAGLRDSQDSINSMSAWCLENRQHHKKIVAAWLNVLKRVKIDHRLTLFYLANDVIQYSKRKNYEFVESWSTSLQKATTLVREEKVKHRILRIFKIWEQRGIYGEEFLADLSGLISVAPPKKPNEQDPSEFQPSYLIAKILACSKLEEDTDLKLKKLKENELKLQDTDLILFSLKDRQHVEDVEKEVEDGVRYVEAVTTALNAEIKARKHLLSLLMQADAFYRTQKGEVKVVANAYRSFGGRVRNLKKRLDEMLQSWTSPVPSPDVNAPSPGPDSDIELPGQDDNTAAGASYSLDQSYSANFYNPVGQSQSFSNNGFSSFIGQNISFDISGNLFNDSNAGSQISDGGNSGTGSNLIEVVGNNNNNNQTPTDNYSLNNIIKSLLPSTDQCSQVDQNQHATYTTGVSAPTTPLTPLPPPPLPPEFTSPPSTYQTPNTVSYTDTSYASTTDTYGEYNSNTSYNQSINTTPYNASQVPYQSSLDEYNPEEEPETWDNVENILSGWGGPETSGGPPNDVIIETPESPPIYEKEAMAKPIEYNDVLATGPGLMHAREDVDHRVLLPPPHLPPVLADLKGPDTDHRLNRLGNKDFDHRNLIIPGSDSDRRPNDIDHRNLISLTGSPRREDDKCHLAIPPPPVPPPMWGSQTDQDYRVPALPIQPKDQDYRSLPPMKSNPPIMSLARLVVEPPPPPPPVPVIAPITSLPPVIKQHNSKRQPVTSTPRRSLTEIVNHDNNESVDMDLSDDESLSHQNVMFRQNSSEKSPFDNSLKNNFNNKRPFQSNNHIFNDKDNTMRKKHAPESEVKNPFLTPNKNVPKESPPIGFVNEKVEQSIEVNPVEESQNSGEGNMDVENRKKTPLLEDPPRPWPEHRPPTPVQDDVPWIQNEFGEDGPHRGTPFRKRGAFRGRRDSFPGRDEQFQNPRNEFLAMGGIDFSNNVEFRGGGRGGMRGVRGGPPRPPRGNGNMWNGRGGGMRGNFMPPMMRGRGGFRGQFRGGFREQW